MLWVRKFYSFNSNYKQIQHHLNQHNIDCIRNKMSSHRSQSVLMSNMSRAQGSALYSFGDTVVQCSIYGPHAVSQHKERLHSTTIDVIYKKRIRPLNRGE